MIATDLYLLKDFLDQSPSEKEHLLSFLDPNQAELIREIHSLPFNPSKGLDCIEDRLSHIHVTWFVSLFQKFENEDLPFLIKALDPSSAEFLFQHFDILKKHYVLKPLCKKFLQEKIYLLLTQDVKDLLPKEALPENPLNSLINLSKSKLENLIDLLSLHDLSVEMKSLICSKRIQQLYALLTESQKSYLNLLKKKQESILFKPIGLTYWDGDEILLKKALHQRGLNRLAKALYDAHPSLIWHICHKLDIGRASVVQKLMKDIKNKKAQQILIEQVADATKLL